MTRNKKIQRYSKLLGGYGLGVFLNQGINLLLIPIFWRVLKPEDFGIIAITQIITLFLVPIYMFGASETIQRFYYKWTEEERPHYLSWFFWFIFFFTLLLTILLDWIGSNYSKYIIVNVPFDPLLRYTLWSTFFVNFINFPIAISRIKQQVLSYNILVNGSFLTQIGIVYYMVKVENLGAYGYIKGFWIANAIWFLPMVYMTIRESVLFPNRKHFNIPINYAAPLSLAGIIEGFGTVLDRYYLDKFLPLATIGFYNLARQFGSIVNVINSVTKLIFIPYIYKINALKNNATTILGEFGLIYGALMALPVVAVCTLGYEAVKLSDPSGVYLQLVSYIPAFAISFYFVSLATIIGRGMDLAGVTKLSFLVPLVGIVASLFVYLTCLPQFGVWAILGGVLAGSFAKSLVNIVLAIHYFPRKLYLAKLSKTWVICGIFYLLMTQIQFENPWSSLALKLLLIVILFALIIRVILWDNLMDLLKNKSLIG